MAREMYLVGVDEDELKPPEPPKQPKTPKGKWENFWYHYKWHTIAIAAAALVITVMVVQFVTQPRYDYQVILVTQKALAYGEDKVIADELAKYGRDVNGDGKILVNVDAIFMGGSDQISIVNQQKLVTRLAAGDELFYIMDPKSYEEKIVNNLEAEGARLFRQAGSGGGGRQRKRPLLELEGQRSAEARAAAKRAGGSLFWGAGALRQRGQRKKR